MRSNELPTPAVPLSRRELLRAGALALGALSLAPFAARAQAPAPALEPWKPDEATLAALRTKPLVYVTPLLADGGESRCHGEVWFFWDKDAAVLATSSKSWKARAIERGRELARVWVGDFGPYADAKDKLASAPTFLARASRDRDPKAFARLLESYAGRYPEEWGKWKPRFESGYADGSRVVLRYTPLGK